MNTEELIHYLERDPIANISALGFFARYPLERVYRRGDSVIALGRNGELMAYLAGSDPDELALLMGEYQLETGFFASVGDWMIPLVTGLGEVEWRFDTLRFILPPEGEVSPPRTVLPPVDPSYASYLYTRSNYQDHASLEYIVERLENGLSAGVFAEGQLIGWCLTHDDASLGVLHVLPEYRRRGYAEALARTMILHQRQAGLPVMLNVVPDNTNSLNLVNKLGFVYDRPVSWIVIRKSPGENRA